MCRKCEDTRARQFLANVVDFVLFAGEAEDAGTSPAPYVDHSIQAEEDSTEGGAIDEHAQVPADEAADGEDTHVGEEGPASEEETSDEGEGEETPDQDQANDEDDSEGDDAGADDDSETEVSPVGLTWSEAYQQLVAEFHGQGLGLEILAAKIEAFVHEQCEAAPEV